MLLVGLIKKTFGKTKKPKVSFLTTIKIGYRKHRAKSRRDDVFKRIAPTTPFTHNIILLFPYFVNQIQTRKVYAILIAGVLVIFRDLRKNIDRQKSYCTHTIKRSTIANTAFSPIFSATSLAFFLDLKHPTTVGPLPAIKTRSAPIFESSA